MKTLLATLALLTPALTYAQKPSYRLYVHPRAYLTQKPLYLYRQLADSLMAPTLRVDSGQVIIAAYADNHWAFISNHLAFRTPPSSSSAQMTPISPTDNLMHALFARQVDLLLVPYEPPTSPTQRKQRRRGGTNRPN